MIVRISPERYFLEHRTITLDFGVVDNFPMLLEHHHKSSYKIYSNTSNFELVLLVCSRSMITLCDHEANICTEMKMKAYRTADM